jgi:sugar lactone lactonase YvrE
MNEEEQEKQQQPEPSRRDWALESDSKDWRATGPSPVEEGRPEDGGSGSRHLAFVLLMGLVLLVLVAGIIFLPGHEEQEEQEIPFGSDALEGEALSEAFDARLLWSTPLAWQEDDGTPSPDSASMPSDLAVVEGRVFILDTNNGRILELGGDGRTIGIWDETTDERLALGGAMAMAAHEGKLYVANSSAGNVLVVDLTGHVERVITPEAVDREKPLRPIGIGVGADGHIVLSDPDNHRVLSLDRDGQLVWSIGSGHRDSGQYGLNSPGSVYLDTWGYLYVVDMLNYAVKKYSPEGEYVMSLGEAGDTEGTFSRPKGIAVDDEGNIFVSDGLLVAVQVFGADGSYLGFIGREDPRSEQSANLFEAPQGMKVVDDNLYVVDRFSGLFAFQIGS